AGSTRLARCDGLSTNAWNRLATSPPTPTFSPSFAHLVVTPADRSEAWKIRPSPAITDAHDLAAAVSSGSTDSGPRPREARNPLMRATKSASAAAGEGTAAAAGCAVRASAGAASTGSGAPARSTATTAIRDLRRILVLHLPCGIGLPGSRHGRRAA